MLRYGESSTVRLPDLNPNGERWTGRNVLRTTCFYAAATQNEIERVCQQTKGSYWISGESLARSKWDTFKDEYAAVLASGRRVS